MNELTTQGEQALEMTLSGALNATQIANKLGITTKELKEIRDNPAFIQAKNEANEEFIQTIKHQAQELLPKAVEAFNFCVSEECGDPRTRLSAAKEIFSMNGFDAATKIEVNNTGAVETAVAMKIAEIKARKNDVADEPT